MISISDFLGLIYAIALIFWIIIEIVIDVLIRFYPWDVIEAIGSAIIGYFIYRYKRGRVRR
jgi:hypothetical protein